MKYFKYMIFLCTFLLNLSQSGWAMEETAFTETETPHYRRLHCEKIGSTQKHARSLINTFGRDKWLLITTEEQTDGIGQKNKSWASPAEVNIYVTYALAWPENSYYDINLSQITALSVSQAIEEFDLHPTIKLSNDVQINKKKVSGILCEFFMGPEGNTALIGVGLNVNMSKSDCEELDQPVTSMIIESQKEEPYDKEKVLEVLTAKLIENVENLKNFGFSSFYPEMEQHLSYIDEKVILDTPRGEKKGIFKGLTNNGFIKFDEESINGTQIIVFGRIALDKK